MKRQSQLKILITGSCGQIGQSLVPILCSGEIFGPNTKIILNLLDKKSQMDRLKAQSLEIIDCAFPLLLQLNYGYDIKELSQDIDLCIMMGAKSRQPGMEKSDLLEANSKIFADQGCILNKFAKPDCKFLVVANPVNNNATILKENCPNIPTENITCLSMLEYNRAKSLISLSFDCPVDQIKQILIWGNHSNKVFPDLTYCQINGKSFQEIVKLFPKFDENKIIEQIQQRGANVIKLKKSPAVISGVYAIVDHLKYWYHGSQDWVSMGVVSDGSFYDIPEGICSSVPVKCLGNFKIEIIKNLQLNQNSKQQLALAVLEQIQEQQQSNNRLHCSQSGISENDDFSSDNL